MRGKKGQNMNKKVSFDLVAFLVIGWRTFSMRQEVSLASSENRTSHLTPFQVYCHSEQSRRPQH